jgi:signal peptidase I
MNVEAPFNGSEPHSNAGAITLPAPAIQRRSNLPHQLLQGLIITVMAVCCYWLISNYLLRSVKVIGRSMSPTLHDSETFLLNRWIYHVRAPRRLDIIVLRDPADNGLSVKRIIGIEGDAINLKDGDVYLNGMKLEEPYLEPDMRTYCVQAREKSYRCGRDEVFVLGDNRGNSVDSRAYGMVPRRNVLGLIVK